jgi:hypothetical protein
MASDKSASQRLADLKRTLIWDCLRGAGLLLPADRFERLIGDVEASIAHYRAGASEDSFRVAHDALRELWHLSDDDDPPVGQIRARIAALPPQAIEYIDRRAPIVVARLFRDAPRDPICRMGGKRRSMEADSGDTSVDRRRRSSRRGPQPRGRQAFRAAAGAGDYG